MSILSLHDVSMSLSGHDLLRGVDLHIETGDRVCLLGRNGSGKSTLMRIMAGLQQPDSGRVSCESGIVAAYLPQSLPSSLSGTALEIASSGPSVLDGSRDERTVEAQRLLSLLGVDEDAEAAELSGGGKRRLLLARVLSSGAEILLLDEPTNHVDLDTVLWLEDYLLKGARTKVGTGRTPAIVFVTHDRAFARRLATRVAEIDRGNLYAFDCGYGEFLRRKDELLAAEADARRKFDKKMREEEEWLNRGVKARRTRDEGRVRALLAMRDAHARRRETPGAARMEINAGDRSGDLVVETKHLSFGYAGPNLIDDLSTVILRGDRVGIVGPNGSGKTTLVRLLLGDLTPRSGTIRLGVGLEVVYLDQMRSLLDRGRTVVENLGDGYDTVHIGGRSRHIKAYLKDFLFDDDAADKPVSILSGGEQSRLVLAKLFARPSNLLVLDEPTNDLDIASLEVLEAALQAYEGTVLLVSHDRVLLDNVVSECLVLPGDGRVVEYTGGYADWRDAESRRRNAAGRDEPASAGKQVRNGTPAGARSGDTGRRANRPRKLSFKESRELEELPTRIDDLESEQARLHDALADPQMHRTDPEAVKEHAARLSEIESDLDAAYRRWEELDRIAARFG